MTKYDFETALYSVLDKAIVKSKKEYAKFENPKYVIKRYTLKNREQPFDWSKSISLDHYFEIVLPRVNRFSIEVHLTHKLLGYGIAQTIFSFAFRDSKTKELLRVCRSKEFSDLLDEIMIALVQW
jgi:hypothetical protein